MSKSKRRKAAKKGSARKVAKSAKAARKGSANAGDEPAMPGVRDSWDIDKAAVTSVTPADGDLYVVATPGQTYHLTADEVKALGLKVPAQGDPSNPVAADLSPVVPFDQNAPDAGVSAARRAIE